MRTYNIKKVFIICCLCLLHACANIVPPSGGKPDTTPPKLVTQKPNDSLLSTRVNRIDLKFDEYITLSEASKELQIAPSLKMTPNLEVNGKSVKLVIPDSLLEDNTTYKISWGKAIRDLNEGNVYDGNPFVFSTGSYFDSLKLKGKVFNAQQGIIDNSGQVLVMLYDSKQPDDILTKEKALYFTKSSTDGSFEFTGLPAKSFKIFALREANDNKLFDSDDEWVGFYDTTLSPITDTQTIWIKVFQEAKDSTKTTSNTATDVEKPNKGGIRNRPSTNATQAPALDAKSFTYQIAIDTSEPLKRTVDLDAKIPIFFSRKLQSTDSSRIQLYTLNNDSSESITNISYTIDSNKQSLTLNSKWQKNQVYILKVLKGFAKDTTGADNMPSKYIFKTKSDEDYATLQIKVDSNFTKKNYLIQVKQDTNSIYLEPIVERVVNITLLKPSGYEVYIIEDLNGDSKWTSGQVKTKKDAELIYAYPEKIVLKAGWEHKIEFNPKPPAYLQIITQE